MMRPQNYFNVRAKINRSSRAKKLHLSLLDRIKSIHVHQKVKNSFSEGVFTKLNKVKKPSYTVAILDDYPIFVEGLKVCLNQYNIAVYDADNLVRPINQQGKKDLFPPDILIAGLPQQHNLDSYVFALLKRIYSEIPIILIINKISITMIQKLQALGVLGCINRNSSVQDFLRAIEFARSGTFYIPQDLIELPPPPLHRPNSPQMSRN